MKILLINIIIFLFTILSFPPVALPIRLWLATDESVLEISGHSNLSTFHCETTSYHGTDTLEEVWNQQQAIWELQGKINMQVSVFDCHHKVMNKDFQETLMAEKFPVIQIHFLSLQRRNHGDKVQNATGVVKITLANKSRKYNITCDLKSLNDNITILEGKQVIRFSDFSLYPPRKMFGMIRVEDEVYVKFNLVLKQITR